MSDKANQAICELYDFAANDLREFVRNQQQMKKSKEAYFRYVECLNKDANLREKIKRRYGLMGVHFPEVAPELAKRLSPLNNRSSEDIRKELKLWEILEEFLQTVGESSYSDFADFLFCLKFSIPSAQAVASAVRTHPELFTERTEGNDKFVALVRSRH